MWSVRETDIWMLGDYRTDDGLIINSVIYSVVATLGALPLFFKMFPSFIKGKEESKPQIDSHLNLTKSQNSFRENDIWHKTPERQRSTESDEENRTPAKPQKRTLDKKVKTKGVDIYTPEGLDYSKNCQVTWFFKEGQKIKEGNQIFFIRETLSDDQNNKIFRFYADKNYELGFRYFGHAITDEIIPGKGLLLCSMTFEESEIRPKPTPKPQKRTSDKKVDATRPNRHKKPSVTSKRKTRKQIQSDLNQLKQLKEEGLISDETWEEKQKEILKDY